MSACNNLISSQNIKLEYGIQTILDVTKLEIQDGDRIGLVGRNGAGKSSLFGVLTGRIKADSGVIVRNCEIAEIMQSGETDGISEGRYISQMRIKDSAIKSGGEKTRLAIASAFSKRTPLLLADEPTTNLDVAGIESLTKMLKGYRGAFLLISHDRTLLDEVCTTIWELEDGEVKVFPGNYTSWHEQKRRERDFQQFEYEQYRAEKKRLEKVIQSTKQQASQMRKPPGRMGQSEWMLYKNKYAGKQKSVEGHASALETRLNQLEKKERPKDLPEISIKLDVNRKIKAKVAAKVENLTVCYEDHMVLADATLRLLTGKKTFLIGENGAGKTTLVKNLLQNSEHSSITSDAHIGYFSQEQENLDYEKTVLENVTENAVFPEHMCRSVLANLYMKEQDVFKKVKVLSGGERVKTALARLLVSGVNLLILDEPTNHMDIYTMEGLEHLLDSYDGTLLVITHDRKLTENLAEVIYEVRDGNVIRIDDNIIE